MIRKLSDLGKKLRGKKSDNKLVHDAIKDEPISIDLVISQKGDFIQFETFDKIFRPAECINAKKGKARLLLDKPEEVLCYGGEEKKYQLFLDKLKEYNSLEVLKPVMDFYGINSENGVKKALSLFEEQVDVKERKGNIAFRILGDVCRLHEMKEVYEEIISKYEIAQRVILCKSRRICSVCGGSDYPVTKDPHGMIKQVPDGKSSGCALVSYNEKAFESYYLEGNENSSVCTNCARTYTEGLNWLLSNGNMQISEDSKGKFEKRFIYTNRKNFGSKDTAFLFWTRENVTSAELDLFDTPDDQEISELINSVKSGNQKNFDNIETDYFYSCTVSGVAARIAVRDWFEVSLSDLRVSIATWFDDIKIEEKDKIIYPPMYSMVNSAQNEKVKNDTTSSRIASYLWNAALKNATPPLWILTALLKRIRIMENNEENKIKERVTPARAALIRVILNRNNKGGIMLKERLDKENDSSAYICGRLFSVLENIQQKALGSDINAGIRERFFSFASTNPAPAFGRLMKMSQNHITKIKGDKPGLAVNLDKELQVLFSKIDFFPTILSLEEQGQFAIGYYHQKQESFATIEANKESVENPKPIK